MTDYWGERRKAVARGLDLSGFLVRTKSAEREEPPRPVEVDETPERLTQQDRAVHGALPYVEEIRSQLFRSAHAPFDEKRALRWVQRECAKAAPAPGSTKARAIFTKLSDLRAKFEQVTGVTIGGELRAVLLRLPDGTARGVRRDSPPGVLAQAAQKIAKATGFSEPAVVLWVLTGAEPRLQRALISVTDCFGKLGAAANPYARRSVVLTLNTPIREADFRRLFRTVRAAFDQGPGFEPNTRGRKGPVITDLDAHLESIVERFPDATWEERAEVWRRTPGPGKYAKDWPRKWGLASGDTLRIRWKRYQDKTAALSPERPAPSKRKARAKL